jgi:methylated-DNA-[protein]-cysteine S-methyltransferase
LGRSSSRDESALRFVIFENGKRAIAVPTDWKLNKARFKEVIGQLNAYFRGELKVFTVPLSLRGTDFQLQVWNALRKIPYGETISYAQLARGIGNPKAVRAVGLANGQNPIPIIIPCHRVIGSDGSLTGFGGGLPNKKKLLTLESKQMVLL